MVDRARRMFDQVTVLVAVNDGKRPSGTTVARAREIRGLLPAGWENVAVAAWHGLTADYCRLHGCGLIIRGVRPELTSLRTAPWRGSSIMFNN